ncbi:MAG: hypothetical protein AAGE01_20920 [Pseudomonadota bacterium]
MNELPRMARGRRTRFFEAEGVDELLSMVLELTTEVATLRERLYVAERVLEGEGIAMGEKIEQHALTDADQEALGAERQRLLSTVLRTLGADATPRELVDREREAEFEATTTDVEAA